MSQSSVPLTLASDSHKVRLNLSTMPFVFGWYGEENLCLIKNRSHKIRMISLIKFRPWSERITLGVPCLHTISSNMNLASVLAPASGTALASGHRVKYSVATMI